MGFRSPARPIDKVLRLLSEHLNDNLLLFECQHFPPYVLRLIAHAGHPTPLLLFATTDCQLLPQFLHIHHAFLPVLEGISYGDKSTFFQSPIPHQFWMPSGKVIIAP